jgi:hypothetical protein
MHTFQKMGLPGGFVLEKFPMSRGMEKEKRQ